ncbi:MAG: hypothetical protein ABIR91_04590 [Candidatus Saccharimonadales bacterium]
MKKITLKKITRHTTANGVIAGRQMHPFRYGVWRFFQQGAVKRTVTTTVIVGVIFAGGVTVYENRISALSAIYAMMGQDYEAMAAELERAHTAKLDTIGDDGGAIVSDDADSTPTVTQSVRLAALPPDADPDFEIAPETPVTATTVTAAPDDKTIEKLSMAAKINQNDNYEQESHGGYDE